MTCPECPDGIMRSRIVEGGIESEVCDRCNYPLDEPGSKEYGQEGLPLGDDKQQDLLPQS